MAIKNDRRVVVAAKLEPQHKRELRKMKPRYDTMSAFIGRLVEAYVRGRYFCPECRVEHLIHSDFAEHVEKQEVSA